MFRRIIQERVCAAAILVAALSGSGCQWFAPKPKPALIAPPVRADVTHYAGTPLSGASASASAATTTAATAPTTPATSPQAGPLSIKTTWLALRSFPRGLSSPLGSQARLVIAARSGAPVLPSARLTGDAQIIRGDDASELWSRISNRPPQARAAIDSLSGALFTGATASFSVAADPRLDGHHGIQVLAHRPATGPIQLALVVEAPPRELSRQGNSQRSIHATAQRETALLDWPVDADGEDLLILLPNPFPGSPAGAIAAFVQVGPGAPSEQTLASAMNDVAEASRARAARPDVLPAEPAIWPAFQSALDALTDDDGRRRSLVYLAGQSGAALCEDVALSADDPVLAELATDVATRVAAAAEPSSRTSARLGWLLDLASLQLLARKQADGSLSPELLAILALHAGEAGRHAASMEQVLPNLADRGQLQTRLLAENLIYLEDASPAARVRAYDWLTARGKGPAGYDPLAPPKQRREALEAALSAGAGQPVSPATRAGVP